MKAVILARILVAVGMVGGALAEEPTLRVPRLETVLLPLNGAAAPEPDLLEALGAYSLQDAPDQVEPLEDYLRQRPDSPWRASLNLNLGMVLGRTGWPSRAMDHYRKTWMAARTETTAVGRDLADQAVTEWMWLCVKAGDDATLARLLAEARTRPMRGAAAQRRLDAERALYAMRKEAKFYLCGPTALATVRRFLEPGRPVDPRDVKDTIPGPEGTSLFQLAMMASHWGIPLQMARRQPGAKILVPSVMHWKVGHWAAVLEEVDGRFRVQEDVLEETIWVRREALDAETTGFVLAPQVALPEGWSRVGAEEGRGVFGRGRVGLGPWFGPYPESILRPGLEPYPSHPAAAVRMGNLGLELWATPISIPNPKGPALAFDLRFHQRIAGRPRGVVPEGLGAHWYTTGSAFVVIEDSPRPEAHVVTEHGEWLRFSGWNPDTQTWSFHPQTWDRLRRREDGAILRESSDGTVEVYGMWVDAGPGRRGALLTERRDPSLGRIAFRRDVGGKLVAISLKSGGGFVLRYEGKGIHEHLTAVEDHLGRAARFQFDAAGRLECVMDASGQATRFGYGADSLQPDLPSLMETVEGTWRFDHGQKDLSRWVELTDAYGKRHRAAFHHDVKNLGTSDPVAPSGPLNQYMQDRSTYYWSPEVLAKHGEDCREAEAIRYLFNPTQLALSWTIEAVKQRRSPRVWFLYPGQVNTVVEGPHGRPGWMARKDEEGEQTRKLTWDAWGFLTSVENERGRVTFYRPAANLGPESGTEAERSASPTGGGIPLRTLRDQSGAVWTLRYDAEGRWIGLQGPRSYRWAYDAFGRPTRLVTRGVRPTPVIYDGCDRVLGAKPPRNKRPSRKEGSTHQVVSSGLLDWVPVPREVPEIPLPSVLRRPSQVQVLRDMPGWSRFIRDLERMGVLGL